MENFEEINNQMEAKEAVVKVEGLYKRYSKKADYAISDVTFSCYEGEIVGLLGHNGAGKSTTLKCIEGMLPFDKGEIRINGFDVKKDATKAKANMGFVTDNHAVFIKMTGMEYISFMATVYKVPAEVRQERLEQLEKVFCLGDAIHNLISSYSHGMRQKICMMGSLIHMPKLWILDEPMTGLDPRTMKAVREFMHDYAAKGNCIIFSSHALSSVAMICDRVVLIRKGLQISDINIKKIMQEDPTFDFEDYFLKSEAEATEVADDAEGKNADNAAGDDTAAVVDADMCLDECMVDENGNNAPYAGSTDGERADNAKDDGCTAFDEAATGVQQEDN